MFSVDNKSSSPRVFNIALLLLLTDWRHQTTKSHREAESDAFLPLHHIEEKNNEKVVM